MSSTREQGKEMHLLRKKQATREKQLQPIDE